MNQVSLPDETSFTRSSPPSADTRLSGTRLLLARGVWLVLMLLFCGFYLAAVLVYYVQLHGFQQGVSAHLISTPAVVSGYTAFESSYPLLTGPYAMLNVTLITFISPFWIAVSLLIFWRRSDDWMALFVALFLAMLATNLSPALSAFSSVVGFSSPLGICITLLQLLCVSSAAFFFVLFPDGRFVPGWTRWLTLVWLALQVPFCLPSTSPFSLMRWPPLLLAALFLGLVLAWGFAQLYRYRRVSTAGQRQQTKWIVFGLLVSMFVDAADLLPRLVWPALTQPGPAHTLYIILSEVTLPLFLLLIPGTIGMAVLRYRLWDVDIILNRTLVYGLLTLSVLGLYLLVIVGLGTLFSALGNLFLSLLATGLVAVLFQPLRQLLQRAVNRLLFGERDEPYRVLARLGNRLEATLATDALLPMIVQTVAQALKLPYAAITYKHQEEDVLAASTGEGRARETFVRVPLVAQTEQVGDLVLAARGSGDSLTPADLRLLHDLAPQIAVAIQAVRLTAELRQLTADLQVSRTQLITAREEERRRLRRDLHDGLGPTLASLTFKIDAARNLLKQDSERADRLLEGVRQQAQQAITDIRHLVYELRPPALDELGLLSALREQAASSQHQGLQIIMDVPENLPPLPAAVRYGKVERGAEAFAQEALQLAQQIGDHNAISNTFATLGMIAQASGKLDEAETAFTESYTHARSIEQRGLMSRALSHLADVARMRGDVARATALSEEALASEQASGMTWDIAITTTQLGHLARQQHNYAQAKARYREALALYRAFGSPAYIASCLEGYAATACAEGHYAQATRLCAQASTLREQTQAALLPAEREAFEQVVASARAALDEPAFAREWNTGTTRTQDEAIDDALSDATTGTS